MPHSLSLLLPHVDPQYPAVIVGFLFTAQRALSLVLPTHSMAQHVLSASQMGGNRPTTPFEVNPTEPQTTTDKVESGPLYVSQSPRMSVDSSHDF